MSKKEDRLLDLDEYLSEMGWIISKDGMQYAWLRQLLRRQDTKSYAQGLKDVGGGEGSPRIICLCGSSRFIETFAVLAWEFEKDGNITVGLHYLPPSYSQEHIPSHLAEHEGVAKQMDELHLRKIDMADEVFVININGYIGKSTSREIDYATKLGKPIKYLEPLKRGELPEENNEKHR
ncbi:hypothetical protein LCGC14_2534020 [marine sediment metagenome]|uniref:Uncharacterized protein n=1 Tax=marine sediment metagenome TaxID=412755 RepID=A0A0F9D466_9ZZZZ